MSRTTLVSFETGAAVPRLNILTALRRAFEAEGIVFEVDPETGRIGLSFPPPAA